MTLTPHSTPALVLQNQFLPAETHPSAKLAGTDVGERVTKKVQKAQSATFMQKSASATCYLADDHDLTPGPANVLAHTDTIFPWISFSLRDRVPNKI